MGSASRWVVAIHEDAVHPVRSLSLGAIGEAERPVVSAGLSVVVWAWGCLGSLVQRSQG